MKEALTHEDLKILLANAKTDKVLEHLIYFSNLRISDYNIDDQSKKEIFLISSRFSRFQSKQRLGIVSDSEANLELNKINIALIELIEKLAKQDSNLELRSKNSAKINWIFISIILLLIVTIGYLYYKSIPYIPESGSKLPDQIVENNPIPNEIATQPLIEKPSQDKLQESKERINYIDENTSISTGFPNNAENNSNNNKESSQSVLIKDKSTKKYKEIEKTIMYRSKPIKDAYFSIRNCYECKSTISGIDGRVNILVPIELVESNKEYDFDIFVSDTLLYSRSMKFSNLNFNK